MGTNLELVHLKGGPVTDVVRDITDILNVRTVFQFDGGPATFVSGTVLAYVQGPSLLKRPLCGSPSAVVAPEHGIYFNAYAWSPDGSAVAYVTSAGSETQIRILDHGKDRLLAGLPSLSPNHACPYQSCADQSDIRLLWSPDGKHISLVQNLGGPSLRVWSMDGAVELSSDAESAFMSAWSGDALYFRDTHGVEVWRGSGETLALPGVAWVRPRASPGGGQIVFATRDGSGMAHVQVLDTRSGATREIAKSRSEPAFLNSHLVWYQEERPCGPSDNCEAGFKYIASGRTFVYDLQDGSEFESVVQSVMDVWPHAA